MRRKYRNVKRFINYLLRKLAEFPTADTVEISLASHCFSYADDKELSNEEIKQLYSTGSCYSHEDNAISHITVDGERLNFKQPEDELGINNRGVYFACIDPGKANEQGNARIIFQQSFDTWQTHIYSGILGSFNENTEAINKRETDLANSINALYAREDSEQLIFILIKCCAYPNFTPNIFLIPWTGQFHHSKQEMNPLPLLQQALSNIGSQHYGKGLKGNAWHFIKGPNIESLENAPTEKKH